MPAAVATLNAMMIELGKTGRGVPKHERITPGTEVAAALTQTEDECCSGIASVRVVRVFPSEHFPDEDPRAASEGGPIAYAVELELMVLRCGTAPGANMAPTDDQLTSDAQTTMDDAAALRRTGPAMARQGVVFDYRIGTWEPVSAEGNCIGGTLQLAVHVGCAEC